RSPRQHVDPYPPHGPIGPHQAALADELAPRVHAGSSRSVGGLQVVGMKGALPAIAQMLLHGQSGDPRQTAVGIDTLVVGVGLEDANGSGISQRTIALLTLAQRLLGPPLLRPALAVVERAPYGRAQATKAILEQVVGRA